MWEAVRAAAEEKLGDRGRIWSTSGTAEPLVRVMAEAETRPGSSKTPIDSIVEVVKRGTAALSSDRFVRLHSRVSSR
ncbi:MAG: hypothetical protein ACLTSX_11655 [Collinsella sp.]